MIANLCLIYFRSIRMIDQSDCFTIVQGFFFTTTLLFALLSIVLMNRTRHLRRKVSSLIEAVALKNKEIDDMKKETGALLEPLSAHNARSIIISVDTSEELTDINDYGLEFFGFDKKEVIGKNVFGTIFPVPDKKDSLQANIISRIFSNPKLYVEHETENTKKDGTKFWISWTNRVIYDNQGNPIEIKSVGFDITKRKKLEQELRYLASIDPLTGVLNRQTLLETGTVEVKRSNRYNRQLSIMVMKLDYFHSVNNDTVSDTFSDDILHETVAICRRSMRDSDSIGRIGDVEFALILPETPAENAVFLAERLKSKIQEKNLKSDSGAFVSATFGVAGKESKDDTIDSLLLRALNALQKTKKKKRVTKIKG